MAESRYSSDYSEDPYSGSYESKPMIFGVPSNNNLSINELGLGKKPLANWIHFWSLETINNL